MGSVHEFDAARDYLFSMNEIRIMGRMGSVLAQCSPLETTKTFVRL